MASTRVLFVLSFLFLPLAACGGDGNRFNLDSGRPGTDGGTNQDTGGPGDSGGVDAGISGDAGACAAEFCGNGLDDDCDESVDEGCPCLPGQEQACYRGTAGTRGVGECGDGVQVCEDQFEFFVWGTCLGDALPGEEVCDAELEDEDCDGAANEGCECVGDEPVPCGLGVGGCSPGLQECIEGLRGECIGADGPSDEICNDTDDDCDGSTDEELSRPCGTDVGACRPGVETCVAGEWQTCSGGRMPVDEACDGIDNDCDGSTDEELSRPCGSNTGACTRGSQTCADGAWGTCMGGVRPTAEECNNVDDDCDGDVDDGVTRSCGSDVGVCESGTQTCSMGGFGTCMGSGTGIPPTDMEPCDGLDNDCDGTADEGCTCVDGAMRSCGTDVGECSFGTQTCVGGGWGACTGATNPVPEVCRDGLDNDCDGTPDDGCPTSPPVVSCPGDLSAEVLTTLTLSGSASDPDGGTVAYQWQVLSRPTGSTSNPSQPSSATTSFFLDAAGNFTMQLCAIDDEGEMACCSFQIESTAPGAIHWELSWDTDYGDVDLHVLNVTRTPPDGWWTTDDCFFSNQTPDWGPRGAPGNPNLDIDDTAGFGPENTTIDVDPVTGRYHAALHYFCEHSLPGTSDSPGGPTTATLRVFCDGTLIATYDNLDLGGTDDWITVASVDYPSCAGMSVNNATTGRAVLPSGFVQAQRCDRGCTDDTDCLSGEVCVVLGGGGPPRRECVLQ